MLHVGYLKFHCSTYRVQRPPRSRRLLSSRRITLASVTKVVDKVVMLTHFRAPQALKRGSRRHDCGIFSAPMSGSMLYAVCHHVRCFTAGLCRAHKPLPAASPHNAYKAGYGQLVRLALRAHALPKLRFTVSPNPRGKLPHSWRQPRGGCWQP